MPTVSIIVPCYNEQATIRLLLDAISQQTYPRAEMEVVIADGQSTDGTRTEIEAFQQSTPDLQVRVVENPARVIPAALNQALKAVRGAYIVRVDAHSVPQPDYVARSVAALEAGRADNVGGVWQIAPGGPGWVAQAIALAAAHPLGVGDASYRYTEQAQYVDTVPFGAFRRSLIEEIGPFDETLLTNEDYEFNVRIRQAGGTIWLDPAIRSKYYARASLGALARQYWRYGFWKARMLRRYPATLRWRQALPPLFVFSLLGLAVVGLWLPWVGWLLALELAVYFLILTLASAKPALKKSSLPLIFGVPLAIATMHVCWGSALIWSGFQMLFSVWFKSG